MTDAVIPAFLVDLDDIGQYAAVGNIDNGVRPAETERAGVNEIQSVLIPTKRLVRVTEQGDVGTAAACFNFQTPDPRFDAVSVAVGEKQHGAADTDLLFGGVVGTKIAVSRDLVDGNTTGGEQFFHIVSTVAQMQDAVRIGVAVQHAAECVATAVCIRDSENTNHKCQPFYGYFFAPQHMVE